MKLKVGILGATGYTGAELLKILVTHAEVSIIWLTSEKFAGKKISDVFQHLRNFCDIECKSVARMKELEKADVVFSCLPHGTSMHFVSRILDSGASVIDFSADFRFSSTALYEDLFKTAHKHGGYLKDAVYGLPEMNRESIKNARLVANPGCYSTGVILGVLPIVKGNLLKVNSIIADAKSGVSGGGRAPTLTHHFSEMNENIGLNMSAAANQRPEMEEAIRIFSGNKVDITFIPHTVSISRGILTTVYCEIDNKAAPEEIHSLYSEFYDREPFIRGHRIGEYPELKDVRHTNYCGIGVGIYGDKFVAVTALDNLGKGASGQAVQNMNIMCGFPETLSLARPGIYP
jgi:N-acetyl-gamma-glutamyl-phosphate reductase